jgi:prepilin-type processing-associated H-X9-DG protein
MQARSVNIADEGSSLEIEWQSGNRAIFEAHQLWRDCPSAHGRRRRMDNPKLEPEAGIRIVSFTPIGLYAINIAFSDGHARGVYPWSLLRKFAAMTTVEDFLIA